MLNKNIYICILSIIVASTVFICSFCKNVAFKKGYLLDECIAAKPANIVQVAIIGGGVSGLAASQIPAKKGLHTVVFRGEIKPGGLLHGPSPLRNWLGVIKSEGKDIIQALEEQAYYQGALLHPAGVVSVNFSQWPFVLTLTNGDTVHALSVVIATGGRFRALDVPGEAEYIHKGIVDEVFKKNQAWEGLTVVVVGGGDDAIRKAECFATVAKKVIMVVRGELNTSDAAVQKLSTKYPNIKILYNTQITAILGNDDALTGVWVKSRNVLQLIPCTILSRAVGVEPNNDLFLPFIATDSQGYILLQGRSQATSLAGVFAAGDVTEDRYHKATIAGADGLKAGYDAAKFLQNNGCTVLSEEFQSRFYK